MISLIINYDMAFHTLELNKMSDRMYASREIQMSLCIFFDNDISSLYFTYVKSKL
jgi:hypothetical protein